MYELYIPIYTLSTTVTVVNPIPSWNILDFAAISLIFRILECHQGVTCTVEQNSQEDGRKGFQKASSEVR